VVVLGRIAWRHVVTSGTRRVRCASAGRSSRCTLGCDRVSMGLVDRSGGGRIAARRGDRIETIGRYC